MQLLDRLEKVKQSRLESTKKATQDKATTPMLFTEIRQPKSDYLLVPVVSSERRKYIPIGFVKSDVIANTNALMVPNAGMYHFGVLTSRLHMSWMKTICGRMKSDYAYSTSIVYNNFPWPDLTEKQKEEIEKVAQGVIDARALYPDSSLADLYDPLTMPPELVKAHNNLDKAVVAAYDGKGFKTEAERVADLMERYQQLINDQLSK
jgi:hypothetical protein